jgi:hypothetical protein
MTACPWARVAKSEETRKRVTGAIVSERGGDQDKTKEEEKLLEGVIQKRGDHRDLRKLMDQPPGLGKNVR